MSRFHIYISNGQNLTAETLGEAQSKALAHSKDGDVYGIEGQNGRGKFYLRRGSVAYQISAKVAQLELAMRGRA